MASNRRTRGEGALFWSERIKRWVGRRYVPGKATPITRQAEKKGDALKKLDKAVKEWEAKHGPDAEPQARGKNLTVAEFLDDWLKVSKARVRIGTWESYERVVRVHLKPRIGAYYLDNIRPMFLGEVFTKMEEDGISRGNAKKISEVLSTAFSYAMRMELLKQNPTLSYDKPVPEKPEIIPFTPSELKKIFTAAKDHRWYALFVLGAMTGARQGELLALHWNAVHLDEETPYIYIRRSLRQAKARTHSPTSGKMELKEPKSERSIRKVVIDEFTVKVLRAHYAQQERLGHLEAPLFCTEFGTFASATNFIKRDWRPLLEKAGVPYRKFHTLRHTHASELLAAKVSVPNVARRLGDSQEVIMKTYSQYIDGIDEGVRDVIKKRYEFDDLTDSDSV